MSAERLQKLLARAGVASRRKVEELILEGRVTVNGRIATLGDKADFAVDSVKLDGKRIRTPDRHRYLLLNKPKGVLTTVSDDKGRPTVMELIPAGLRGGLFPVGRLDFHTEGLLILTTDGDLALRIAHPRYGCRKIYEVKVKGVPHEEAVDKLRRGIVLDGRRTLPARIDGLRRTARFEDEGNTWYEVQLGEGRSRQIREMFFRIGHPVQKLRRVAIGPLRDSRLAAGESRPLTEEEVEALRTASERRELPNAAPRRPPTKADRPRPARREPLGGARRAPRGEAEPRPTRRGPRPAFRDEVRRETPISAPGSPRRPGRRDSERESERKPHKRGPGRHGPRPNSESPAPRRRPNQAPWMRREDAAQTSGHSRSSDRPRRAGPRDRAPESPKPKARLGPKLQVRPGAKSPRRPTGNGPRPPARPSGGARGGRPKRDR